MQSNNINGRGLRNMTSDYPEVRNLLRVLALRIERSAYEMNGQNIGKLAYETVFIE